MATTRGQFSQLIAPATLGIIFNELKEFPEEYSQFLKVESIDGAYKEDQVIAGLGLAVEKNEGAPIVYDDPIQGGSKRYIPRAYSLAWQITMEMKQDDKYGVMRQIPSLLAQSVRQKVEQIGANVLNLGASTITTAHGQTLFHTAQNLLGGGTYSNRLNPDADMSITSLQNLTILFENMVDDRGLKKQLTPTDLWFPPDLQFTAGTILQSSLLPGTGNNDVNTMQGRFEPHVLHFLTDTNNFFISSNMLNHAKFVWRMRPEMDSEDDFETKGTKHSIIFRADAGASDWRGWAASMP